MKEQILPAPGKLGVLVPGLGAAATTFLAGVEAVKKGLEQPVDLLTRVASIRLSFYFKSLQHAQELRAKHDICKQFTKLQNTLRHMMGEDMITYLGLDDYQEPVEICNG